MLQIRTMTAAEFEAYARLPENADRDFEFMGGEIVEVVSNPLSSQIAMLIGAAIVFFVQPRRLGHVTGADGGYIVSGERYIPDVGFISYAKLPELAFEQGYVPFPPDLAVEVLSPSNDDDKMRIKVTNYLAAGTVVWVVNVPEQNVEVYLPGKPVKILSVNETLDGSDVLPGFQITVRDIFPPQPDK